MKPDMKKIERTIDQHQGYLGGLRDGIVYGVRDGIREGVSAGVKRGVKEGLAQGLLNVGEGSIEDMVGSISELAISTDVTKETSGVVESGLRGYLDRLSEGMIDGIRGQRLVLTIDQIESVVELIDARNQKIGQRLVDKLPRNPISSAVAAGVQNALGEGLKRNIHGFTDRVREVVEVGAEGKPEAPQRLAGESRAEQTENVRSRTRESVAGVVEEVICDITRQATIRAVAKFRRKLKEKALGRLEEALKEDLAKPAKQKLERALHRSAERLSDEAAKDSADKMSFAVKVDGSFSGDVGRYLSRLLPRFPRWPLLGVLIVPAVLIPILVLPDNGEKITTPNIVTAPLSGVPGDTLFYTARGASSNLGHPVEYIFYWGDGTDSGWHSSGTHSHSWPAGTYIVRAQARCATHTDCVSSWSSGKTVTIGSVQETITTPNTPIGPSSGVEGDSLTYSTGEASSNLEHHVEYRFDWGDGTSYSSWSPSISNWHQWQAGTYTVRAQARCATHTGCTSSWSGGKTVTIAPISIWFVHVFHENLDTLGNGADDSVRLWFDVDTNGDEVIATVTLDLLLYNVDETLHDVVDSDWDSWIVHGSEEDYRSKVLNNNGFSGVCRYRLILYDELMNVRDEYFYEPGVYLRTANPIP